MQKRFGLDPKGLPTLSSRDEQVDSTERMGFHPRRARTSEICVDVGLEGARRACTSDRKLARARVLYLGAINRGRAVLSVRLMPSRRQLRVMLSRGGGVMRVWRIQIRPMNGPRTSVHNTATAPSFPTSFDRVDWPKGTARWN